MTSAEQKKGMIPSLPESARKKIDFARSLFPFSRIDTFAQRLKDTEKIIPQEVLAAYELYKPQLEQMYGIPPSWLKTDYLYHGTGMYKYGGDKYGEDEVDQRNIVPVLESILANGIKPHRDTWLPSGAVESVSFAVNHQYVSWYTAKYQPEINPLKWSYGNPTDWFYFFIADTVKAEIRNVFNPSRFRQLLNLFRKQVSGKEQKQTKTEKLNKLQSWLSSLTTKIDTNTSEAEVINSVTDINENWGVVLVIDRNTVPTFIMDVGAAHEVRTKEQVDPTQFVAIEAPLDKVEATVDILSKQGLTIPVLPLECVEYHLSQFSLKDLTKRTSL